MRFRRDGAPGNAAPAPMPREVWVLVSAGFVIALGYGVVAPALPEFAASFGVDLTAASAIVSAFAVMRLVFAPTSGRLVTRFGERPMYLLGVFIVALSTLAAALAQTYWQLMLFRGLGGVGSVMFSVAALGLLIRISPPAIRGRVSGLYSSSFVLGSITGPVLGGALVGFGLRVPFVVYAVTLFAAITVVHLQLRHSTLGQLDGSTKVAVMPLPSALRIGAYRSAVATAAIFGWVYAMRVSLVPLYFARVLHQHVGIAGLALATYACGDVIAMMPAGRLSDRIGRRPLIVAGMTILALATLTLAFTHSVAIAFASTLIGGIGTGMVSPSQQAVLADVMYGHGRGGPVLVTYQMSQDLGTVIGPVAGGFLAQEWGFPTAFTVTALLAAVAAAAWLTTRDSLVIRAA
ncbi:MFS transporter [Flexivirga caeni]|uniref:MFS transporter n=1 Tax=Flexivirga caeni TaxID=2294115 RepID=A0A3M9MB31_9MICO|nr:MFS transporter [Flexivirga caeni]RNI22769.1 MFS transporter [Flexivirga caeni]